MKVCELTFTVCKGGSLKIPAALLAKMRLSAGDHIRIAYLTDDGAKNAFKEFLFYSEATADYKEEQRISIPSSLLQQANIPPDDDIQITCLDGVLIIGAETKLNLSELTAVLEGLTASVDITEDLPTDTASLLMQLKGTIDDLRREYES